MDCRPLLKTSLLILCSGLPSSPGSLVVAQVSQTTLPFAGADAITVVNDGGQLETLLGQIQDIVGETLTFRRNGAGKLQFLRMDDVVELQFHRSEAWVQSVQLRDAGNTTDALRGFEKALREETRTWAWIELQATVIRMLIQSGQRRQAVERIEEILKRDANSRYVVLVPLVWDERLPLSERISVEEDDLDNRDPLRRMIAASVFLHDPEFQNAAKSALQSVRKDPHAGRLRELAEAQLWRLALVEISQKTRFLNVWRDRVQSIHSTFRHGPQLVIARCLQQEHRQDEAAVGFLWTGLMSPTDPALAALGLTEAAVSLKAAGQILDANRVSIELRQRFPEWQAERFHE